MRPTTIAWKVADRIEKDLKDQFPTLYCNVQPDQGQFHVRVSKVRFKDNGRGPFWDGPKGYFLDTHELIDLCPSPTLIAQLMLVA